MSRKRKNAGAGYGYMFHGAFKDKKDAVAKERKTKGAWVKGVYTKQGHRYVVMSPRTNPIKRKHKNPDETRTKAIAAFRKMEQLLGQGKIERSNKIRMQLAKLNTRLGMSMAQLAELARGGNPHELLIMGANPSELPEHTQEISLPPGSTIVIRTPRHNPVNPSSVNPDRYTAAHAIAKGITRQAPGLIQTQKQRRVAGMVRSGRKHKYDWIPPEGIAPGQNPRPNVELGTYEHGVFHPWTRRPKSRQKKAIRRQNPSAAAIREDFTGMPAEWETTLDEPHMPAGDYAQLGELLALYVKASAGAQVQTITFKAPRPILVSDQSARQLYFVGGDQDVSQALEIFGAHSRGAGLYELGEARRIDYKQRKEHVGHPEHDEWRHQFGEETGVRPTVLFDYAHKRLVLEGGAYEIRREGIVN